MSDETPASIFTLRIADRLANQPDKVKGLTAIYQFNITGDNGGNWAIRLNGEGGAVVEGSVDSPGVTITMKDDDFVAMIKGTLNPNIAFMSGRLKVAGDIGLALRLQQVIG